MRLFFLSAEFRNMFFCLDVVKFSLCHLGSVVFDPPWQNDFRPEMFVVFFGHPVEVIRLHERENLTAYATNMSGLDVPWRASFGILEFCVFFFPIGRCFLLTIWSMAGHTSPNTFVFLLVLFRLVCNREAKNVKNHGFVSCLWFWIFLTF